MMLNFIICCLLKLIINSYKPTVYFHSDKTQKESDKTNPNPNLRIRLISNLCRWDLRPDVLSLHYLKHNEFNSKTLNLKNRFITTDWSFWLMCNYGERSENVLSSLSDPRDTKPEYEPGLKFLRPQSYPHKQFSSSPTLCRAAVRD